MSTTTNAATQAPRAMTAGQDRTALVVAQREQLVVLIRSAVLPGALERLGQQRVRQCLSRDPLGVQLVRLPALTRPVRPRRAIGAHITHVIAAGDQEDRGVAPPARRPLDSPPRDRPELPSPHLQRSVPIP